MEPWEDQSPKQSPKGVVRSQGRAAIWAHMELVERIQIILTWNLCLQRGLLFWNTVSFRVQRKRKQLWDGRADGSLKKSEIVGKEKRANLEKGEKGSSEGKMRNHQSERGRGVGS